MKAEIVNGKLELTPESKTEEYALDNWVDANSEVDFFDNYGRSREFKTKIIKIKAVKL
jgi:hypothetical protein